MLQWSFSKKLTAYLFSAQNLPWNTEIHWNRSSNKMRITLSFYFKLSFSLWVVVYNQRNLHSEIPFESMKAITNKTKYTLYWTIALSYTIWRQNSYYHNVLVSIYFITDVGYKPDVFIIYIQTRNQTNHNSCIFIKIFIIIVNSTLIKCFFRFSFNPW